MLILKIEDHELLETTTYIANTTITMLVYICESQYFINL